VSTLWTIRLASRAEQDFFEIVQWTAANFDTFAKTLTMAKQKFRPTRLGVFSGTKAYI
jgi:hypothetical protein